MYKCDKQTDLGNFHEQLHGTGPNITPVKKCILNFDCSHRVDGFHVPACKVWLFKSCGIILAECSSLCNRSKK